MTTSQPTLLICDDGTRTARHTIEVAAEQFPGARATILSIQTPARNDPPDMERHAVDSTRRAQELGLDADWVTRRDDTTGRAQAICDVAAEQGSDMIVIGSAHKSAFKSMLLGSLGSALARTSHLPVLCVPDAEHDKHPCDDERRALVCYDHSAASEHAITATARLLSAHDVVVLTVWDAVMRTVRLMPGDSMADFEQRCHDVDDHAKNESTTHAEHAVERLRSHGLQATSITVESWGATWWPIHQNARSSHADIIVLGSRGLSGLRAALDSTSRAVLAHATCPIMLVPECVARASEQPALAATTATGGAG